MKGIDSMNQVDSKQQQKTPHWYNDHELFLHGLVRSNYVTAITDWFMGFAGKWAELVLYGTVLYSCAELYPGVHLPDGLSLGVFLVQLGALDIGGLSLAKLAKQAREDGDPAGAANAETLSKWLIGIMLVGVVTVGLEHVLPVALPSWVMVSINVILVVARSICAVLYGRVVHDLKHEMMRMMPIVDAQATFTEHLQGIEVNMQRTLATQIAEAEQRITERLSETLRTLERTVTDHQNLQALAELTALPAQLERQAQATQAQLRGLMQEVKAALEANTTRPRLALIERVPNSPTNTSESGIDKAAFVRSCLTENPNIRNADIQRKASEQGVNISPAYISEVRKAFLEEQSA
jgi:hypothetical protein